MKITSPTGEISAVVNLCSGTDDVQTYLIGSLRGDHFGVPASKEAFERIQFLVRKQGKHVPNIQTLSQDLALSEESRQLFVNYKKVERIKTVTKAKPLVAVLDFYRKIRICYNTSEETLDILKGKKVDPDKILRIYEESAINGKSSIDLEEDLIHIGLDCNAHNLVADIIDGRVTSFIPTGFKNFDMLNGGFRKKGLIAIAATTSGGKAQPLYSKIKIPNGWVAMGDIKIDQEVCTPDGKTAKVINIYPQGVKDVYRITFDDGRSTDCCEDHLWKVYNHDWKREKVLSLKEIKDRLSKYARSLYVKLPNPLYGKEVNLPIDPYILGCLLGDGSFVAELNLSCKEPEISEAVAKRLDAEYILKKYKNQDAFSIIRKFNTGPKVGNSLRKGVLLNKYKQIIRDLGLGKKRVHEKFIPEIYKESSVQQRLNLLKGLLDTDGYVSVYGVVSYTSTSYQLALDVQYLVRSLGGSCRMKEGKNHTYRYKHKGKEEIRPCRKSYTCCVKLPNLRKDLLFNLSRKRERADRIGSRSRKRYTKAKIINIKYVGRETCQCIVLDHPEHLYITDNYVVTHNSCMATQILINMYKAGYNVVLVSLEMDHEEILTRILANISRVDAKDIMLNTASDKERKRMAIEWTKFNDVGKEKKCKYSIYTPQDDVGIKDVCYRLARFNYSVLVVDYISLLRAEEEQWKALSEIARFTKIYVKQHNMVGVLLCQLSEEEKIRYSRAIKEHADNVWSWVYSTKIAEETNHIITVDQQKARNQLKFPFKIDEKFSYMTLTDCLNDSNGESSNLDELEVEDDLEEF